MGADRAFYAGAQTVEPPAEDRSARGAGQIRRLSIEIVKRAAATPGFQLLPRRWVVERTLAWLNRNRRLAKDFKASIRLGLYCLNATLRPALSANTTKAVLSRTPSWSPEPSVRVIIQ